MFDRAELKRRAAWRLDGARYLLYLTQHDFAERYGISYGQVLDIIAQRSLPSLATRTLIEAIRLDAGLVERAARNAREHYGTPLK